MTKVSLLLLALTPSLAAAGVLTVPEPGTFELLSIGAIALVVAAIRGRRK